MITPGFGHQCWGVFAWGITPVGRRPTTIDSTIPTTFTWTIEDPAGGIDPFAATVWSSDIDPFAATVVEASAGIDPFDATVEEN